MSNNKEFDMIDAFVALRDLDDDSVSSMVTSKKTSRRSRKLTEGKGYPIHGAREALNSAREFLNENDEVQLEVIDANADDVEHMKDRIDYVGQMILRCNRCHANRFIDMEALVEAEGEEGVYNVEDECPNCKTSGTGYELIGQVGKVAEEEKPAEDAAAEDQAGEEAQDEATEEPAVENDEANAEEVKFDNDLEAEEASDESDAEAASEETADNVEEVSDEEETEPDMMETDTTEDDDLDLPDLAEEEEDDDSEVQESFYKPALYEDADKAAKNKKEALMYDKIMDKMANEDAADAWADIWPKYKDNVDELSTSEIRDLKDEFEEVYRKYHNDGLLDANRTVINACKALDKEFDLSDIENHQTYEEAVEVITNTTISEVLGSCLDADKVGRIEITNKCDNKKDQKVYDGDYNNLPLNLANATCTGFDVDDRTLACNIDQDEAHGRRPLADILGKFGDDKSENIHLYDIASSDEIFKGKKADAVSKYGKCGFISIDTPAVIRFTICDPSIVSRCAESAGNAEDELIESIIEKNGFAITRLNKATSNEYWIKESIKEREDLDVIYEAYVKPFGRDLMAQFKEVTGYSNALDEAFEAGYAAASKDVDEVFDYYQDGDTFELEWFRAAMLDEAGKIVTEDFATVTRHVDGSFTVDGEIMFSDGHTDIVDALVDAVESIPDAEIYADIEYTLEDELNDFMTSEQKAALASRLDRVVEEVEISGDAEQAEIEEDLGGVFRKIFDKPASINTQQNWEERIEYLELELENPDLSPSRKAAIRKEISKLQANFAQQRDWEARHSEDAPQEVKEPELAGSIKEGYMNRDQMIAALRANGRNYRFDKYTDAQIYRMYQKHALAPQNKAKVAPVIDTLVKDEVDAVKTYDKAIDAVAQDGSDPTGKVRATLDHIRAEEEEHIEELNNLTCEKCGVRLNDGGTCPSCDHGDEDVYESINESVDATLSQIVKDSINHMINDLGYDANDEEFADDVLADIEDNYDVDAPTEPRAYAAWASEIFAEISRQVSRLPECMSEDLDDDIEWPVQTIDYETLKVIVDEEMPFAIRECGKKLKDLLAYFVGTISETDLGRPDPAQLKELIISYLERDADVNEEFKSFKTRKELAAAITECKNNSRPYTVRRSVKEGYRYDLLEAVEETDEVNEGDNLPASRRQPTELTSKEAEFSAKVMRISQDIAAAINTVYGIDANPELIVADILQDLRLIRGDINVRDLEDTPMNRLTAQMYQSYEDFYAFMDELVSGLTGQTIHTTPERKFEMALRMLDGPNFTREAIRKGIEDTRFMRMVSAGQVPFVPANARPLIGESVDPEEEELDEEIEVNTDQFDAEMNEYFNEAYEDTLVYTTTGGSVEPDGTIMLEGVISSEDASSDVNFTLTPEKNLYESLLEEVDRKSVLENATYEVKNNVSEEVFKFKFSK